MSVDSYGLEASVEFFSAIWEAEKTNKLRKHIVALFKFLGSLSCSFHFSESCSLDYALAGGGGGC